MNGVPSLSFAYMSSERLFHQKKKMSSERSVIVFNRIFKKKKEKKEEGIFLIDQHFQKEKYKAIIGKEYLPI